MLENRPELIAQHCTEAAWTRRRSNSGREAGELAIARSASHEAVAHLQSALDILARFPESRHRDKTELGLADQPGRRADRRQGFAAPETGGAFARAWSCASGSGRGCLCPVLYGR